MGSNGEYGVSVHVNRTRPLFAQVVLRCYARSKSPLPALHVYEKPYHPSQVSVQHRAASERFRAIKHTIDNAQADLALEACFHFQRAQHCIYSRRR